jgi:hypothetical protein
VSNALHSHVAARVARQLGCRQTCVTKQLAYPPSKLRSWSEFLEEYESHLAWSTTAELTEATEHVVTAVNGVRFEDFVATAVEPNAYFFKDVVLLV